MSAKATLGAQVRQLTDPAAAPFPVRVADARGVAVPGASLTLGFEDNGSHEKS